MPNTTHLGEGGGLFGRMENTVEFELEDWVLILPKNASLVPHP